MALRTRVWGAGKLLLILGGLLLSLKNEVVRKNPAARVNAVAPGWIASSGLDHYPPDMREHILQPDPPAALQSGDHAFEKRPELVGISSPRQG